jgi:AmiR/NasT family two-component response regulator
MMNLRVVIADDESITRADLRERLESENYDVVGEALDGFDVIGLCRQHKPDIAILDIKMPILDGLSAAKVIHEENPSVCVVMLTAYSDNHFIEKANIHGVMGYIVKPIDDRILLPTLKIAVSRNHDLLAMQKKLEENDNRLEERKIIERAKGLLMKTNQISEKEAYDYIRTVSMNKRCPMKKVAEMIIINHENLH